MILPVRIYLQNKKQKIIKVYFAKFVKIYLEEYRILIKREALFLCKDERFGIKSRNFNEKIK
jgi:hypothetical protein